MIAGREDSPPKLGGVAAPSRNAAKPPKYGADGVVPQQSPANRSFGTTPPARPFLEFDGLAGTPPNLGVPLPGRAGPITARNFSIGPEPSMIKRRRGTRQR